MIDESAKQEFIGKYGDPLDGLDLTKPVVIWFPTYFTVKRIIFALTTIYMWDTPVLLLGVRMLSSLVSFLLLDFIVPY